jgi:hypothetical protein
MHAHLTLSYLGFLPLRSEKVQGAGERERESHKSPAATAQHRGRAPTIVIVQGDDGMMNVVPRDATSINTELLS